MLDPAKSLSVNQKFATVDSTRVVSDGTISQSSRMLQDAFITLTFGPVSIDAGQYKLPLGLEGSQSSGRLITVERGLFMTDKTRGAGLADVRDLGATVRGQAINGVDYQLGVFNSTGEHQNGTDRNPAKAVVARVQMKPAAVSGLQLGASGSWGGATSADNVRRDRLGGDLSFRRGPLTVQSELMLGYDGALRRAGWYGAIAWQKHGIEPVLRVDSWDPDRSREDALANVTGRDVIAGLNLYIADQNVKVQANYVWRWYEGVASSRNLLLLNLQTSW